MGPLLIVLCALAGVFRAFHDCMTFTPTALAKWGPFFDSSTSWTRKYADYYHDPVTPRFWGSTTVFVFVSDAWHLSNALSWGCADAALLIAGWQQYRWYVVAGVAARRIVFEPLFSRLRKLS